MNGVGSPVDLIVLSKLPAQALRLDSHDGVHPGIVAGAAVKDVPAHQVLFQLRSLTGQSAFDGKSQKATQAFGGAKSRTGKDSVQVRVNIRF